MDKKELLTELLKEIDNSDKGTSLIQKTIVDQNEELIATYVEGTKRVIKATDANSKELTKNTSSVDTLSRQAMEQTQELKQSMGAVERAIKGNKVVVNTTGIERKLTAVEAAVKGIKFPTKASEAIPVRMSDGKKFIKNMQQAVQAGTQTAMGYYVGGAGGGKYAFRSPSGNETTALIDEDKHVQVDVLTMPGVTVDTTGLATEAKQDDIITAIEGISAGSGVAAYSDSGGTDRKGLVDAERHVQVDVLTAPTTTVTGTVTANLSATDNQVLDDISADTGAIATDAAAIEALLTTIEGNQLADGHNVTIDNSTGAAAVNIQDGGNSITVDGTVTAELSAVDNAVLDQIELNTDDLLTTTDFNAAFGTAGSADSQVLSIQGIASMTPVQVSQATASNLNAQAVGNIAHDGADSGNPVKIGGRAQEPTAQPEEVADNDRVDALFDRNGRIAVWNGSPFGSAVINAATSGNNTLVAAAGTGKIIRVTSVLLVSDGTVDVRFESGANGTALTGQMPLQEREGFSISNPDGLFQTAANTLLNLELSGAVNVHGFVTYRIVDD